jgi:hypothetical protein
MRGAPSNYCLLTGILVTDSECILVTGGWQTYNLFCPRNKSPLYSLTDPLGIDFLVGLGYATDTKSARIALPLDDCKFTFFIFFFILWMGGLFMTWA